MFDHGPGADHPTASAEFDLATLIDVLNPLQHLPVISSLYRHLTGDEIDTPARVMGGTLYGGPLGFLTSLAIAMTTEVGGADPGAAVLAKLLGSPENGTEDLAARPEVPIAGAQGDAAGTSATAALQGEAALDALARDLARPGQGATQVAAASDPAPAAAAGPETSPQDFFAARMLSGLDKYQAMAQARGTGAPDPAAKPGSLLDRQM